MTIALRLPVAWTGHNPELYFFYNPTHKGGSGGAIDWEHRLNGYFVYNRWGAIVEFTLDFVASTLLVRDVITGKEDLIDDMDKISVHLNSLLSDSYEEKH